MVIFELCNLYKSYGSGLVDIFRDIWLKIDFGEFLIFVGFLGCGKLILMNCIVGLESIIGGVILVDGQDISGMSFKDCDIVMVFQFYVLYLIMSVCENIVFGLKICKMFQVVIDEEVVWVVWLLQIEYLFECKFLQFFGGQQQWVVMGWVLVWWFKVYLFDELLFNFDVKLWVEMCIELKLMYQWLKIMIVYVIYDQIEVMIFGDKVVVMKDGVIQQFGMLQQIYNDLVNLFVVSFIGLLLMNFILLCLQCWDGCWIGLFDSGQDCIELLLSLEFGLEEGCELIFGV